MTGDLQNYGLPKPDHKHFESHPLVNSQILHYLTHGDCIATPDIQRLDGNLVVFKDSSREDVDLIVCATGYKNDCPFLPDDALEVSNGRPDLYLRMFSRRHTNLAILGFIEFASAAFNHFDAMKKLIVLAAMSNPGSDRKKRFDNLKQVDQQDLKAGATYIDSERHANYADLPAFRPLQIQPVFPAERALLRGFLWALKSCELIGQDTSIYCNFTLCIRLAMHIDR